MDHAPANLDDAKRNRVLDGAMRVFLSYGYQRVTMDDIAKTAEMSRPALYLLFKNKADIYRAIGERMFEMSSQAVDRVLTGDGSLGEKLNVVVDQIMIEMMCQITDSPHGAELLDLKNSLAADVVEGWHTRSASQFSKAIEAEAAKLGVNLTARGLSADGLAELLMDGLEGMKHRVQGAEAQRVAARQLVRVIELALKP
ncbi:MAG: TetR/AcrR family transcriptional regulator [Rhizobiaceae bacterium]